MKELISKTTTLKSLKTPFFEWEKLIFKLERQKKTPKQIISELKKYAENEKERIIKELHDDIQDFEQLKMADDETLEEKNSADYKIENLIRGGD